MSGTNDTVSWLVTSVYCDCGPWVGIGGTCRDWQSDNLRGVELPVTCGKNKPRWASALYWAILIAASAACRFGLWSTDCLTSSFSGWDLNAAHQRAETSAPVMKC